MAKKLKIGIIGDFEPERPSHKATVEAIGHSADYLHLTCEIEWYPTKLLETGAKEFLASCNGIWCAPGSPYQSMEGALKGIRYARENNIPFIGTCGGFQHAALEFAKNKLGLDIREEKEGDIYRSNLFISQLSCSLVGETKKIYIYKDTCVYGIYGEMDITEKYNCNFGLNKEFETLLNKNGFLVSGVDEQGEVRILELPRHKFYIATLFQPQLSSAPEIPHKLINAFLAAI